MHSRINYNHRLLEATKARAEIVTAAALYGRGVFTTLAVYDGHPFQWRAHWQRLMEHAMRAGVEVAAFDEETARASLLKLIVANDVKQGRARLTLLAGAVPGVWETKGAQEGAQTSLLMMTGEARVVGHEGLALTVSPYRLNTLSPLAGLKSVNYLEHIMALEEARARDFDEAVALNERGEVASTTMANLFWTMGGTVHTPALSTGALAGTTRSRVIELAHELSIPTVEGVYDLSDLGDADEIFLTSAGLGVALVTTFDFHRYTVAVGSVALRLHEAFRQLTLRAV
ncbi:MAG: 4-amino-4-deoxychorismate lyase [Blastocatellia bacterium]|jgi:branched-subunit amino acid aminotransferase/4-amino-4-deoxychorismate lyase|nr:4-amino-4-deoxychorismate lyase [Blastocatellia bacterium]